MDFIWRVDEIVLPWDFDEIKNQYVWIHTSVLKDTKSVVIQP